MNNRGFDYFALTVAIIGAINWGLIGFFKFDLVSFLFGDLTVLSRIVYAIVGICGLYLISVYGRITSFNEVSQDQTLNKMVSKELPFLKSSY